MVDMTAAQLAQYNNLYNNLNSTSQTTTPIAMTAGGSGQGMQNFMNSPAYALQYGNNQLANPADRFLNDPGVQMAIKAGMPQLQAQYAARGLGASGPAAEGLSQYMYNNYNNFVNQQQGLFGNYQSQLANLANFGAQNTGAAQANQTGNLLANLLGGYNMGTGQGLSANQINTGSNISSLLGNQGVLGANAYLGTAAAQANAMLNAAGLGAQMSNAQAQTNAGSMNSLLGAQGYMNYANSLMGGMGNGAGTYVGSGQPGTPGQFYPLSGGAF